MLDCIRAPVFRLVLLISSVHCLSEAASAYPRSSDIFVHVADYGHTAVYMDQFLRAFDVLAFSILAFTIAFCIFTIVHIVLCYRNAVEASKRSLRDEETASDT